MTWVLVVLRWLTRGHEPCISACIAGSPCWYFPWSTLRSVYLHPTHPLQCFHSYFNTLAVSVANLSLVAQRSSLLGSASSYPYPCDIRTSQLNLNLKWATFVCQLKSSVHPAFASLLQHLITYWRIESPVWYESINQSINQNPWRPSVVGVPRQMPPLWWPPIDACPLQLCTKYCYLTGFDRLVLRHSWSPFYPTARVCVSGLSSVCHEVNGLHNYWTVWLGITKFRRDVCLDLPHLRPCLIWRH